MVPPAPLEKKVPGSTGSRKNAVMAIVILLVIVIISLIAFAVLFPLPAGSGTTTSKAAVENALVSNGPQPVRQPTYDSIVRQVNFVIDAGSPEKCGLTCRQLTPTITNTGDETAHNVCISLVLSNSGGDQIFLNSAPSLRKCIGNIASGESKSETIVIEADCGFLASKCIRQTLILKTVVTCDEKTIQFPDQIIAV